MTPSLSLSPTRRSCRLTRHSFGQSVRKSACPHRRWPTISVPLSKRAPRSSWWSLDHVTPAAAVRGADAVEDGSSRLGTEKISAIPNGSLSLVQLATRASPSGLLETYGLPLGAFLGLLIGLVFAVAIERADPRADDVEDLARATGTAASAYPGPVSLGELEQLLDRASDGAPSLSLVPLSDFEMAHAIALRTGLEAAAHHQSLAIEVAGPIGSMDEPAHPGRGAGRCSSSGTAGRAAEPVEA